MQCQRSTRNNKVSIEGRTAIATGKQKFGRITVRKIKEKHKSVANKYQAGSQVAYDVARRGKGKGSSEWLR